MAYQRFLTNKDYRAVLTEEQFKMLVNGDENRLAQAERSAEMNFLEYLDQHYEMEKLFCAGKAIREYNSQITYPANVYFKKDGIIYRTLKPINGCKAPDPTVYWESVADPSEVVGGNRKCKYSQLQTYGVGDIALFGADWWICKKHNGYDLNNIQIPGVIAWRPVETIDWQPNMEWEIYQVCEYKSSFYMKSAADVDTDKVLTPETDDTWSLIGEYSQDYNYTIGEHDYVVKEGCVYEPLVNPNADKIVEGEDMIADDPRNPNVVTHMVNIACYYLHQMISPTNISETRRWAYEDSMTWLSNAARFKINPKLPRRHDNEAGGEVVDFALETYQREFNPNNDMWLI